MASYQKDWVDYLSALLTPTIAIVAAVITYLQWRTNELKRKQELFDRRYAFYQRLRAIYLSIPHLEIPINDNDLSDLAEEAQFLFGLEVAKHIVEIERRKIPEQVVHGLVDDWFIEPFKKYLELK